MVRMKALREHAVRKSVAATATSEARRKSMAEVAEARKSLVEASAPPFCNACTALRWYTQRSDARCQVMQMYGPDEEAADVKVNRTSLSGWCPSQVQVCSRDRG